jgi:DNA polymerase-1
MATAPNRLFLIDGYSNIFRAFYAIRELSNSKGEPTNAVWGFLNMLRKLLREEQPELVGIALDVSGDTVRKEQYADYKANRKPMPEELRPQIAWIRKLIEAHRIPILELVKYEADDVLGTLSRAAAAAGLDVVIVSADKDLMQLVDPRVSLFHTGREKLYGPEEVEQDYGVPPAKIVDYLALVGDTSDNVPGVPMIGGKTAAGLLAEYGSLDELLARAEEIKGKRGESLRAHRDDALLSRDLVTIHTDLPVAFEPEALRHEPPDPDRLRELYRELEFHSLIDELEGSAGGGEPVAPAVEAETAEEWRRRLAGLGGPVCLAAIGDPAVGLAAGGAEGEVVFADLRRGGMAAAVRDSLAARLDGDGELLGHDLKEVLRLWPNGAEAAAPLFDTMLVSYVLRPALRGHGLAEVALDRLDFTVLGTKEAGWEKGEPPMPGAASLLAYAGERVELARRLEPPMRAELERDEGLARVYREIEAPLVPVLVGMEEAGVLLDVDFLAEMSERLGGELDGLETAIYEIAGHPFNLNSPKQLGEVLFEELGYPVIKKTRKTKSYSTSAEILQELAVRGYPVAEHLLRYRELSKLKSTYVDALPELVAADGRLHTRFHQAVAATGRLSSASPNLQNIPIRTEAGQEVRRAFRAPPGKVLLVADYNQIELRILAHIAGEARMIEAFAAGEDIHRSTAAAMFGAAPELVTAEQRRAAKMINFGIIYGISPYGLANNLGIGQSEAKSFIDAYFERYPGVQRYMDDTLAAAAETGKVETLYGRVRWLPELKAKNYAVRENAKRMAINARIQGTAADLLKLAMIAVDHRLRAEHPEAGLLLTVHDELVLEVPAGEAAAVGEMVRAEMTGTAELAVPLVADVGSGPTWYEAKTG